MAKFEARQLESVDPSVDYAAPDASATAVVESRLLDSRTCALWMAVSTLAESGSVSITAHAPGAVVFVERGGLRLDDGRECPTNGAVLIGRGLTMTASTNGPTRLVHFGGGTPHPESEVRPVIQVVGDRARYSSGSREGVLARWYADSSDERCAVTLMHVAQSEPDKKGPPHSHSADEIIYVLEGDVTMGAHRFGPGTALFIPRDVRYALGGGPDGYGFLNFRSEASSQTYERSQPAVPENALARGGTIVDDFR